jgi:hypothetical protein
MLKSYSCTCQGESRGEEVRKEREHFTWRPLCFLLHCWITPCITLHSLVKPPRNAAWEWYVYVMVCDLFEALATP